MNIHTIVLFIFVTRLPEGSTQTDFFTAGVYTVTQEALDEAPEKYGRFLLQILDEMQTVQVPPVEDWDNCNVRYRVGPAKQNSSIQLITNSLKLTLAVSASLLQCTIATTIENELLLQLKTNLVYYTVRRKLVACNSPKSPRRKQLVKNESGNLAAKSTDRPNTNLMPP